MTFKTPKDDVNHGEYSQRQFRMDPPNSGQSETVNSLSTGRIQVPMHNMSRFHVTVHSILMTPKCQKIILVMESIAHKTVSDGFTKF